MEAAAATGPGSFRTASAPIGVARNSGFHMDETTSAMPECRIRRAQGQLLMAWQTVCVFTSVAGSEMVGFRRDPDVGMIGLSRGLNMFT